MMRLMILCAVILTLSIRVDAQIIKSPAALDMDSTEFAQAFGTIDEYNLQVMNKHDGRPVLVTKYKYMYVDFIATYLASQRFYGRKILLDDGDGWVSFEVPVTGIIEEGQPEYVMLKAYIDDEGHTEKLRITGGTDDIISLFVGYWPFDISLNQLKQGGYVYQDYVSDRVTFSWKGDRPVIEVVSNPNVGKIGSVQ